MKKHIIYLVTDANRIHVEAAYCQDFVPQLADLQFSSYRNIALSKFNRIVHIEEFTYAEQAQKRLSELNHFTRMQKERLIRRYNPNWLNICNPSHHTVNMQLSQVQTQAY